MTVLVSIIVMTFCLVLTFAFHQLLSAKEMWFALLTAVIFTLVAILLVFWLFKLLTIADQGFQGQF